MWFDEQVAKEIDDLLEKRRASTPPRTKKRILMFAAEVGGCCHYRLILPAHALSKTGKYECRVSMLIDREKLLWDPDVIVFARQSSQQVKVFMDYWRERGKKVIYDVDDNLFNIYPSNPASKAFNRETRLGIKECMKACSLVTVSTLPLKELYKSINNNIVVLPNQILNAYKSLMIPNRTGYIRIGWSGSPTHVDDFEGAIDAIEYIANKYDKVKFVFFGYMPPRLKGGMNKDKYEFHDFVSIGKYHIQFGALSLDIALAPLKDIEFNVGKSNLKILEAGVLGIPIIASKIYPYENTIEHGKDGLLIEKNKPKKWIKAMEELIENQNYRISLGKALQEKVLANYDVEKNVHLWEKAYFGE